MIFHSLEKFIQADCREILLVTGTEHAGDFTSLLGSGSEWGCDLTYRVQDEAGGIAQALGLAEGFARGEPVVVLLGDNIFQDDLKELFVSDPLNHAKLALKEVLDPSRYGVAELGAGWLIRGIEEKPAHPKSNYAVTGAYRYPADVFEVVKNLKPSARGELEITDVNNHYLFFGRLSHIMLKGFWTDAGTPSSLRHADRLMRGE